MSDKTAHMQNENSDSLFIRLRLCNESIDWKLISNSFDI